MTPQSLELFYSYSHKDEELRDQLEEHLAMLKREGVIANWHDRRISGGREWEGQIDKHLNSADIILLLTSSAFLASDYCYDVEVKRAMERHQQEVARVIPVILRACDWRNAPFGKLQAFPKDGKPVKQWPDPDVAFLDIANGIRRAAEEMRTTKTDTPEKETESESLKPDPYLLIPNLRVSFVRRHDTSGNDIVKLLQDELSPQRPRLVALWGAGGVGKTAIAAEAVRDLVEPFAKRIAWVSADGLESFTLITLLDEVATQLGNADLRKLSPELKKEQVRDLVRPAATLVVLDNFETIEESERTRCVDWLGKPAPCCALITTRDVVEGARNIPVEAMRPEEANSLLDQLIRQAHDARAFTKLNRDRLIQTAESNPLVLQWIVGQIDLAQDPDEVLDDLQHGEGKAADRVFNRSYELRQLDNGGRAVLLALSLFAPSATRKAVSEVSGFGKDSDKKKFRDAVRSLSALWLIHTTDQSQRLAVEGLTRELTKARLNSDPRGKTFRPRFVARLLRYAERHTGKTAGDFEALESEKDNLLNAIDIAFYQRNWQSVRRLINVINNDGVNGMLAVRGYWDEATRYTYRALEAARFEKDDHDVAVYSHRIGLLQLRRGSYEEARSAFEGALATYSRLGSKTNVAVALDHLGVLAELRGEIEEARRFYNEALQIDDEVDRKDSIKHALLRHFGSLAEIQGLFEQALCLYGESLEIDRRLDHQSGIASGLHVIGRLARYRGDLDEARRLYNESFELRRTLGDQSGIASSLQAIGRLAHDRGELYEAERLYNESLGIEKKLGDQHGIANCLRLLGRLSQDRGELGDARLLYDESLKISKTIGHQLGMAASLHEIGTLYLLENNYTFAETILQESLEILRKVGDELSSAECLESMGKLRVAQGQLAQARPLFDQGLGIAEKIGVPFRIASLRRSLGLLAEKEGNKRRAALLIRESLPVFDKLRSPEAEDARRDLERVEGKPS